MTLLLKTALIAIGLLAVTARAGDAADAQYPVDTALMRDESGGWQYRSFPSGSRLFVYSGDAPGKSNCNQGCASAWPPLYVSDDNASQQIGHWTVIIREDGSKQWAYKGQPVYRRYHDLVGDIEAEGFRVLKP